MAPGAMSARTERLRRLERRAAVARFDPRDVCRLAQRLQHRRAAAGELRRKRAAPGARLRERARDHRADLSRRAGRRAMSDRWAPCAPLHRHRDRGCVGRWAGRGDFVARPGQLADPPVNGAALARLRQLEASRSAGGRTRFSRRPSRRPILTRRARPIWRRAPGRRPRSLTAAELLDRFRRLISVPRR